jgi:hypothetical protein
MMFSNGDTANTKCLGALEVILQICVGVITPIRVQVEIVVGRFDRVFAQGMTPDHLWGGAVQISNTASTGVTTTR